MNRSIQQLLDTYPRPRPHLPDKLKALFEATYRDNRDPNASPLRRLIHAMEAWMHRQVASRQHPGPILELGPGLLNHLPYEPENTPYDIVEPNDFWYRDHPRLHRLRHIYADMPLVPLPEQGGETFGRILSIAALEHIPDLPRTLARAGLLLRDDGLFQAGIPAEGSFLWGLGWRLTSAPVLFLTTGMSYKALNRHEHLNRGDEILALTRHFFAEVEVRHYPLPWYHLSFYLDICAQKPRRDLCRSYLESLGDDLTTPCPQP